jgi:hypothetical protein
VLHTSSFLPRRQALLLLLPLLSVCLSAVSHRHCDVAAPLQRLQELQLQLRLTLPCLVLLSLLLQRSQQHQP